MVRLLKPTWCELYEVGQVAVRGVPSNVDHYAENLVEDRNLMDREAHSEGQMADIALADGHRSGNNLEVGGRKYTRGHSDRLESTDKE